MDLGIVNHASLGPESGNFRTIHRPEVPNFRIVCRLARARVKMSREHGCLPFPPHTSPHYRLSEVPSAKALPDRLLVKCSRGIEQRLREYGLTNSQARKILDTRDDEHIIQNLDMVEKDYRAGPVVTAMA
jgi:hypothetical protein